MSSDLRLVVFDVDGTLVDSQADILSAMAAAFAAVRAPVPARDSVLGVVGLSLDVIFPRLMPELGPQDHRRMSEAYKDAYMTLRAKTGVAQSSPLYPGARDTLEALQARDDILLGVATGKSKRGLDKLIEGYGLEGMFVTRQVADFHPSKPHPSMLLQAMADAGVEASQAVMVGDTSFDMQMARSAGMAGIGVSWGYHPTSALSEATMVINDFGALAGALDAVWKVNA